MKKYTKGWETYMGSSKPLKVDIAKYGIEQFTRKIIEECSSLKELQEREIFHLTINNVVENDAYYNQSIPHPEFRIKGNTNSTKGKSWEEIYGPEYAAIKRAKLASRLKDKTWEEVYGVEKANKLKKIFSYPRTQETKKKMSQGRKGIEFTGEHRKNLSLALKSYFKKCKEQQKCIK